MRKLFCLICASPIEERAGRFSCTGAESGGGYPPPLGYSIRRAVYGVDAPATAPRSPEIAPYLWCPNCTGELEDYDGRDRRLQCSRCGLMLPATDQLPLSEIKADHGPVSEWME